MASIEQRVIDGCDMIKKQMENTGIQDWGRLRHYFNISYSQVEAIRNATIPWTDLERLLDPILAFWNLSPERRD